MTTNGNGNGWRMVALKAAGALLLLVLGWVVTERRHDHRTIEDHEKRIAVLEAAHK